MSHRSARTTVLGRLLIVQRHQAGWPQAHIAAAMGISRKCVKTWLDRYAGEGEPGLRDRTSRPHTSPRRTSSELEARIVTLRQRERCGPDWLGCELGVPTRTVSRVLARHQVPRLAALDPITGQVIRASKTTAVRYERDRPGELVHMDVKKLGRIPDGITRIERLMTDNAWAYRWSLREACAEHSIRQTFIKPDGQVHLARQHVPVQRPVVAGPAQVGRDERAP